MVEIQLKNKIDKMEVVVGDNNNQISLMKESIEKAQDIIDRLEEKCYKTNHKIVEYESRIERLERLILLEKR